MLKKGLLFWRRTTLRSKQKRATSHILGSRFEGMVGHVYHARPREIQGGPVPTGAGHRGAGAGDPRGVAAERETPGRECHSPGVRGCRTL